MQQQAMGFKGFLEEDAFLGECNLGNLELTSGRKEIYWLLAIRTSRVAKEIDKRDRLDIANDATT